MYREKGRVEEPKETKIEKARDYFLDATRSYCEELEGEKDGGHEHEMGEDNLADLYVGLFQLLDLMRVDQIVQMLQDQLKEVTDDPEIREQVKDILLSRCMLEIQQNKADMKQMNNRLRT